MMEQYLTVTATGGAGPVLVLRAAGEIDRDSRHVLATAADRAIRDGVHHLVLDLAGVRFCDSSGLSLFVALDRETAALGGGLRLAAVPPPVTLVLTAMRLDRVLALHATVDDAVRAATTGDA
jgi:anti-sigma B factor antagonist